MRKALAILISLCVFVAFAYCGVWPSEDSSTLSGMIRIDGSSTVFPITEAVAEEFQKVHARVRVTVGISGTGGGMEKFTVGETDISDASRPIKTSEAENAAAHDIEFIELPIAFDGISVVVHHDNDFVDHLTVQELNHIWRPDGPARYWDEVRPGFPHREITLYGPGTDSGTFDYFTKAVNGDEQVCRADFTASEDDNVLVQGIAGDEDSIGFFGYAYYVENTERLKLVPVDNGDGPVAPSGETINNGTYQPLSRPIFIYVSNAAAERPEVEAFVQFYLENATQLVEEVGYVPLPQEAYDLVMSRFEERITGTVFSGGANVGVSIEDILRRGGR